MVKKEVNDRIVVVKNARLSFPHLHEPQEQENDDGSTRRSYNCVLMVPKEDNPHLDSVLEGIKRAGAAAKKRAWGNSPSEWPKIPQSMTCFKDGDNDDHFTTPRDEYAGHYVISTSAPEKRPPNVLTNRKDSATGRWIEAVPGQKGDPYAGCYVNAIIELYAQKKDPKRKMPNRINASIQTVQFRSDGEPFGAQLEDPNELLDEDDVSYEGEIGDDYGDEGDDDDSLI